MWMHFHSVFKCNNRNYTTLQYEIDDFISYKYLYIIDLQNI